MMTPPFLSLKMTLYCKIKKYNPEVFEHIFFGPELGLNESYITNMNFF